ncbi:hypothetical protein C3E97_002770 [Pseudomonas sp. MWU12-2115]|nr:hypothetical protein C3E97_002770 [Pseudomonas sp. MWU12-2115]
MLRRCSGCFSIRCASWWKPPANANPPRGSGLAREGGVSVKNQLNDTPPSRASPLPQGGSGGAGIYVRHDHERLRS